MTYDISWRLQPKFRQDHDFRRGYQTREYDGPGSWQRFAPAWDWATWELGWRAADFELYGEGRQHTSLERSDPATAQRTDWTKRLFLNRLRSLFNIDGFLLPELDEAEQYKFMRDPVRYLMSASDPVAAAIWREIEKRQGDQVTEAFMDRSAKAAIGGLMSLEATAKMLEQWAPECFPADAQGKVHFARALMEAAAESIREAFANAIKQVAPPRTPAAVTAVLAKAPDQKEGA